MGFPLRRTQCGNQVVEYPQGCVKIRDMIKPLASKGWYMVNQEGSHRQYKNPTQRGRVTIAGHPGKDLSQEMISSILKQAGLTRKDIR